VSKPGASARFEQLHERVADDIERHGQHLMGVGGGADNLPFMYTIGNHRLGLPELLVIGSLEIGDVLNYLGDMQRRAGKPLAGLVSLGGKWPVKIVDATGARTKAEYTIQVGQHFRTEDYRVSQVVIPDRDGRFPGEPGCTEPYASVPLLGQATYQA
jgi:hypothetical protein